MRKKSKSIVLYTIGPHDGYQIYEIEEERIRRRKKTSKLKGK